MKGLISIIGAALSIFAFCETEIPEEVRVKIDILVPEIGEKIFYKVGKSKDLSFYAIDTDTRKEYLDVVANSYETLYTQFVTLLDSVSVPTAQKTANLNNWNVYMSAQMAKGQTEQSIKLQQYQDEKLQELEKDDTAGREEISDKVTEISNEITANNLIYKLHAESVNTKLTTLEDQAIQELTGLEAQLVNVNEELLILDQKSEKTESDRNRIAELEDSQRSYSTQINELIKVVKESNNKKNGLNEVAGLPISIDTFTNNNFRVMTWMGLTTNRLWWVKKGVVKGMSGKTIWLPKKLEKGINGIEWRTYLTGNTYQDQLNEYGNIAYLSSDLTNKLHEAELTYPYSRRLYEDIEHTDDGPKTNVMATFKAPKNWADGRTIINTNGYYEAVTKMNVYSSSTPTSHETHEGEVAVNPAEGKKLIFRSAQDSDVRIDVSTNRTGDVILTFGVYWK